jgi:predicted O-methyltransferase YrrM
MRVKGDRVIGNMLAAAMAIVASPLSQKARRAVSLAASVMRAPPMEPYRPLDWTAFLPGDAELCLGRANEREGNATLTEIAVLCQTLQVYGLKTVLEIGTFDGRTTFNLARHAGPQGRVTTVNLPDAHRQGGYIHEREGVRSGCRFHGTPEAARIREVFRDTRALRPDELGETYEFVFIDGDHSAEGILCDARLARAVLVPTGRSVIAWHDADFSTSQQAILAFCREHAWPPAYRVRCTRVAVLLLRDGSPVDAETFAAL